MLQTDDRLNAIEAATTAKAQADDSVQDLIALILDPARFAAHVAALESRIATATADDVAMNAELAAFDSQAGEQRAKIDADHAAINEAGDLDQLIAKEAELTARRATIVKLKHEWEIFGENDEVRSGHCAPLFPALVKARRAHDQYGSLSYDEPDPHFAPASAQRPAWQTQSEHRDGLARTMVLQETTPVAPRQSAVVRRRNRNADVKQRGRR